MQRTAGLRLKGKSSMSNKATTKELKKLLAHEFGGNPSDWKRTKKATSGIGDVRRDFINEKLSEEIIVTERPDGLLFAETEGGEVLTARLSRRGRFNARAAKPSAVDRVMNDILSDRDPSETTMQEAIAQGLAARFAFSLSEFEGDEGKEIVAVITPKGYEPDSYYAPRIAALLPEAQSEDDCVVTLWRFPAHKSATDITLLLASKGFTLDKADRAYNDAITTEVKAAMKANKLLKRQP
jgi:hypothetical protein